MKQLLVFLFFVALQANGQTVVNYNTWTSASGCNIFAAAISVPATVNGTSGSVLHLSTVGQPKYDGVDKSVLLEGANSPYAGTEYRLAYNFKQAYNYSITVKVKSSGYSPSYPPQLRLKLTGTTGSSNSCFGPQSIDQNVNGALIRAYPVTSPADGSYMDIVYAFANVGSTNPYLTVANIPQAFGGNIQKINIRQITIAESLPPASAFSISPSTFTPSCGSAITQRFSVNPPNISGITGYTWNLGAGNGWLYQGAAAPTTPFTTATNYIDLSTQCGINPKNVSVTFQIGATSYGPYTATVSPIVPSPAITETAGKSLICSGTTNNYTISNLPCGASSTWSVNMANVTGGTPGYSISGNTLTINNPSPAIGGYAVLTGTINTACGSKSSNLTVYFSGAPSYPAVTPQYPTACKGGGFFIEANSNLAYSYNWGWDQNELSYNSGGGPSASITLRANANFDGSWITVSATNSCGTSPTRYVTVGMASNCPMYAYAISPNPAAATVAIAEDPALDDAVRKENKGFTGVEIFDNMGNPKKKFKYGNGTKNASINVADLQAGNYILRIFTGKAWEEHKLVIVK